MNALGFVGAALLFGGWTWAVVDGFRNSGRLWGALNLIVVLQPIIAIVSAVFQKIRWLPAILMLVGGVLAFLGGNV